MVGGAKEKMGAVKEGFLERVVLPRENEAHVAALEWLSPEVRAKAVGLVDDVAGLVRQTVEGGK